jgi:hypothetical protein
VPVDVRLDRFALSVSKRNGPRASDQGTASSIGTPSRTCRSAAEFMQ